MTEFELALIRKKSKEYQLSIVDVTADYMALKSDNLIFEFDRLLSLRKLIQNLVVTYS